MQEALRGKHYDCDEEVKTIVRNWPHQQSAEFYLAGMCALICKWKNAIKRGADYVER